MPPSIHVPGAKRATPLRLHHAVGGLLALAGLANSQTYAADCTATPAASLAYMSRTVTVARQLQVPSDYPLSRQLPLEPEATQLADAGKDIYGRRLQLAPDAARALAAMEAAAAHDGVAIAAVSGYRSFRYQRQLLQAKLHRGIGIDSALRANTAPGFSEHHTGCAVDLATRDSAPADAAFAGTKAYRWLTRHAAGYGFHLSYAAGNPHGIEFEPWHWRFTAMPTAAQASASLAATPAAPSAAERSREAAAIAGGTANASIQGEP
ncbi:MAG: M15 family metallopeptidase [Rhodanobacter sp.]